MVGVDRGDITLELLANQAEMHPTVQQLNPVFGHYHGLRVDAAEAECPTSAGLEEIRKTVGEWADEIGLSLYSRCLLIKSKLTQSFG